MLDAVDWASTPLGPVESWSPTLRGAVDLMLHSKFPMTLLWGQEFVLVYNDAYAPMIGDKHPAALGLPAEAAFPEAWSQVGPMMRTVTATREARLVEDELVPLQRHGFLEDCYFTFSYSAVTGADGAVEGLIDITTETTRVVRGRRRTELLVRLSESLAGLSATDDVRDHALSVLRGFADDLVEVDIRLTETGPAQWSPGLPPTPYESLLRQDVVVHDAPDGWQVAWARTEASPNGREPSVVVARLNPRVRLDDELLDLLRLTASVIGRALDRARTEQAERAHREQERQLSETLQRSLLTSPAQRDGIQVAVRYAPAASEAQVGGDWYDAFLLPDGQMSVVIGDVSGHDRDAAASMAQVRNLLRGVSMSLGQSPAAVLRSLEAALTGLAIDVLATGIVAHVVQPATTGSDLTFRWSNAGHPPPVVIGPDGSATQLHTKADLLLGVAAPERHDHAVSLAAGSSVVLYTDGLIERRGALLDDGLDWLEQLLTGRQDMDAEEICDLLLGHMPPNVDDDVALLVLTVDRPA